jgi:mannose-6-phosphate isomerase-like protein (cupin superfamily)
MYEVLYEEKGIKVKKITVKAGNRLSLQKHSRREEFWTIISGDPIVYKGFYIKDLISIEMHPSEMIYIDKEEIHRIQAITNDVVFIEIQKGDYLEEDDIVRIEDDYNR